MRIALAVATLALVQSGASAATFGELPFRPVGSAAACLAPTGVPGGLVRWTPGGAELLDATSGGLVPQAEIPLGRLSTCPATAIDASGAGVIAGGTRKGVRAVVRDPGGTWGAPVALSSKLGYRVTTAVSARGDVVVAWLEYGEDYRTVKIKVARRSPGGAFGTPQQLAASDLLGGVAVGLTATGEAWAVLSDQHAVRVTNAAAGTAFPAPRRLLSRTAFTYEPTFAVADDGRILLAVAGGDGTTLFDREPGGEFVRRPAIPAEGDVALALADDGTAVLAWESSDDVTVLRRSGTGPFGAPVHIRREQPRRLTENAFSIGLYTVGDSPPLDPAQLRVALGADGRALLAWPGPETGLQAASLGVDGKAEAMSLGSPVRPATGLSPLLLPDGSRAVAWGDGNELFSVPPFSGRLHLALEGAADTPTPTAPELTIGVPRDRALRPVQPLRLPVRCSAACDVRAYIVGRSISATLALARAGSRDLELEPNFAPVAPKRGPLKITLSWSAPGARTASRRTISVRVRRLPAPRLPHLLDVRARRGAGGVVDVRWRTDGPAQDAEFIVVGTRTRTGRAERDPKYASAPGGTRRRSFHVRLRDASKVRYVTVVLSQTLGGDRSVRVRVQ
ncbi:hypothetical protein [Solirubrobacter soli]|uniref:hypothetical protein n=1 Tax=Solirubrobacter soli TaxID=363832 RepID=UPI000421FCFE|nr:hypothetical protein [Solirubrobacter soli]